jgi:hypothetical protein
MKSLATSLTIEVLIALFLAGPIQAASSFSPPNLEQCLLSYQEGDLEKARSIAQSDPNLPIARLVLALCQVHGRDDSDRFAGLETLKQLFGDPEVERGIRIEAGLSRTRVLQLLARRDSSSTLQPVQMRTTFQRLINLAEGRPESVQAAIYCTESLFDDYFETADPAKSEEAFSFLEMFIATYTGAPRDLIPAHLYLEGFYLEIEQDYAKSFFHLQQAHQLGIGKLNTERTAIFKLGRICDLKLADPASAERYYRMFLKRFPYARRTPLVKRYLRELDDGFDSASLNQSTP